MSFISVTFFLFFIVVLVTYHFSPKKYRYLVLLISSYLFYGWAEHKVVLVLLLTTIITYWGGRILERRSSRWIYSLFFFLNLSVLLIFKYTNFAISNLNKIAISLNPLWSSIPALKIILPIGLSFYVFQSTSYLSDVYRGRMKPERNFLKYASFVSFFPTLLSGPIQKARELIPQIISPKDVDFDQGRKGFILFVWGIFQKLVIANSLAVIVNHTFKNINAIPPNQQTMFCIISAISFSLYIYADFSSYSDLARGTAKLLGIEVGRNFNNPYLSTSTSEFWRRWHVSLNDWFVENIYIPLGGNKKGKLRKYLNVFSVFFISGLWHGAAWNFVVWGCVNGIFVIIGQLLTPLKQMIYKKFNVDENVESVIWINRIIVFWLITITWVFFRNDINSSLYIIRKITLFSPIRLFVPEVLTISGTAVSTFLTFIATLFFCFVQCHRQDEANTYRVFKRQPVGFQILLMAILLYISMFVWAAAGATVNTDYLYFQF